MSYNYWTDINDKAPVDHSVVTNFDVKSLPLYEEAIHLWDDNNILYIKEDAYDVDGNLLKGSMALHCNEWMDLSDFWEVFESIKK